MVEISYKWVSQLAPFCIWYPCCESSLRFKSPFQSRHVISQEPHNPLDLVAGLFPQDSLMSSCNCIIMIFSCLIEPYVGFPDFEFQPYSSRFSHVQPCRSILYIFCILILSLSRGDFPPSVTILHMCPCIENRYVPLLGTSLFNHLTLVSSQSITLKQFYSFSSFLNI